MGYFWSLASQRPALLDDTINAQLNTKIIFRTVRSMDLSVISEETDLGERRSGAYRTFPPVTALYLHPLSGAPWQ